jgi:hypothetical protein
VISALYQKISGSPLTVLDLICLMAAIPYTLLYKIFYGGSEATPPFTTAQVNAYCSSPIKWPWIDQIGDGDSIVRSAEPRTQVTQGAALGLDIAACILGIFNALTDSFGDYLNAQDYAQDDFTPPPEQVKFIGWINVVVSFLQMGVSMPWTVAPNTAADQSNLTNSLVPVVTWFADVGNMVASSKQTKFVEKLGGPSLVGTLGVLQLIGGIVAARNMRTDPKYTTYDQIGAVMGSFSPLAKWVTYLATDAGPVRLWSCIVGMAALDIADDLVVPILSLVSDRTD